MKTKFFSMLIALIVVSNVYSQSSLNDYKYVIVPNKFDFLKENDQYQMNSLTVFLFEKYGFTALKEGSTYPSDIYTNRCLALNSEVTKASSLFKTKLIVKLKDCNGKVVYTSQEGISREKEYKKSYIEALRSAFKSFETIDYAYVPNANNNITSTQTTTQDNNEAVKEIQKLKEELQTLKKEKEVKAVKTVPAIKIEPAMKKELVEVPVKEIKTIQEDAIIEGTSNVLYAQETSNGFQLVDSSPKVVYKIKNTGANNVFLVDNKSAIIYKDGDNWILEYYVNSTLKQEALNIKF